MKRIVLGIVILVGALGYEILDEYMLKEKNKVYQEEQIIKKQEEKMKKQKEKEWFDSLPIEEQVDLINEILAEEITYKIKNIDSNFLDDDNYEITYDKNNKNIIIDFGQFSGRFPDIRFKHSVYVVKDIYVAIGEFLESNEIDNIIFNAIRDDEISFSYTFNIAKMKNSNFKDIKTDTIHFIDSLEDIDRIFE